MPTRAFPAPSAGNIFGLLASKILELALQSVEDAINGFIVDPINAIFDRLPWPLNKLGRPIPRACFTGFWHPSGKCFDGDSQFFDHFGCYNTDRARADEQCYFFRLVDLVIGSFCRTHLRVARASPIF